jgi:hypothetical protein
MDQTTGKPTGDYDDDQLEYEETYEYSDALIELFRGLHPVLPGECNVYATCEEYYDRWGYTDRDPCDLEPDFVIGINVESGAKTLKIDQLMAIETRLREGLDQLKTTLLYRSVI